MWNYTTETILNDLSRVSSSQDVLKIVKLNTFAKANVKKVYKRAATAAVNEVATIAMPAASAGLFRISMNIRVSNMMNADYNRFEINAGKPIYAEVNFASAPATSNAQALAMLPYIQKALQRGDFADVTVAVTGVAPAGNLVFTATNEYQRFISINLEKYNTATGDYDLLVAGTVTTPGAEGFGTAWSITKNLRLPTAEALRFMAENQDELPINGMTYNQYTIQYEVDRNIGGIGILAEKGTSVTTHVIYVLSSLTTFETTHLGATGLNVTITTV